MGKRSNSGITSNGTPGGSFPDKLPDIKGVSDKQIQYAENMRDNVKFVAQNFDTIYEKIRPIMIKDNVTAGEAIDKYVGIDPVQGATIAQTKQANQYLAQIDIAMHKANATYIQSDQSPDLQAKINQAKIQYSDELIGKNKNRLPARLNQRVVLDYTIETLKNILRTETSAPEWINLGKR